MPEAKALEMVDWAPPASQAALQPVCCFNSANNLRNFLRTLATPEPIDQKDIPSAEKSRNAEGSRKRLCPRLCLSRPALCGYAGARLQRGYPLSSCVCDAVRLAVGGQSSDRDDRAYERAHHCL